MSAKKNGKVRVGSGRYDWYFTSDERCLIERLVITIEVMCIFPETEFDSIMTWLSRFSYPWCTPDKVISTMPRIIGVAAVEQYLKDIQLNSPA